jgi:hypothetical protein
MAYLLYRNGNKHIIWGKSCEYAQFADEDVDQALKDGWVMHPNQLAEEKEVQQVEPTLIEDATFEEIDTNDSGKLSSDEVRQAAKEAGIDGWEKKRINTLKKELGV